MLYTPVEYKMKASHLICLEIIYFPTAGKNFEILIQAIELSTET